MKKFWAECSGHDILLDEDTVLERVTMADSRKEAKAKIQKMLADEDGNWFVPSDITIIARKDEEALHRKTAMLLKEEQGAYVKLMRGAANA